MTIYFTPYATLSSACWRSCWRSVRYQQLRRIFSKTGVWVRPCYIVLAVWHNYQSTSYVQACLLCPTAFKASYLCGSMCIILDFCKTPMINQFVNCSRPISVSGCYWSGVVFTLRLLVLCRLSVLLPLSSCLTSTVELSDFHCLSEWYCLLFVCLTAIVCLLQSVWQRVADYQCLIAVVYC